MIVTDSVGGGEAPGNVPLGPIFFSFSYSFLGKIGQNNSWGPAFAVNVVRCTFIARVLGFCGHV